MNSLTFVITVASSADIGSYAFVNCDAAKTPYEKACGIRVPEGGSLLEAAEALSKITGVYIPADDLCKANKLSPDNSHRPMETTAFIEYRIKGRV